MLLFIAFCVVLIVAKLRRPLRARGLVLIFLTLGFSLAASEALLFRRGTQSLEWFTIASVMMIGINVLTNKSKNRV